MLISVLTLLPGVAAHSELNVVRIIFQFSQPVIHPTISIEALQVIEKSNRNFTFNRDASICFI